jgi:L-alanine-DL-glutamate epimerase-like enolase superfamily enzyme
LQFKSPENPCAFDDSAGSGNLFQLSSCFMPKPSDIRPVAVELYLLPVSTRVPLKFGSSVVQEVSVARVKMCVEDRRGRRAEGWGETPLSVAWGWPSATDYGVRRERFEMLAKDLAKAWAGFDMQGHPLEVGHAFLAEGLPALLRDHNLSRPGEEPMPWLAALITCSAFDLALHDAFGQLLQRPVYDLYGEEWLGSDLDRFLKPSRGCGVESFKGLRPDAFFEARPAKRLPAWHLVGGLDPLSPANLTGDEPRDGYPVLLKDWVVRDGLKCLKVKLRGNDPGWDYARMVEVGRIGLESGVEWFSADFNCTAPDTATVNETLDRLLREEPDIFARLLYVEQPFPYDLEANAWDVRSVSARKPLFMDESAHDWKVIGMGRDLGWSGVALKTCKTQTEAILSACWAKVHGMPLMVQDLTNPMLAMMPHVQLAAHVGTIMGIETNAPQFYPDASKPEAEVHPRLYRRQDGIVSLESLGSSGFGYRLPEIRRQLPPVDCVAA